MSITDLHLGIHWVWNFFNTKVKNIGTIVILSGHTIDYDKLQFRTEYDNLLSFANSFTTIDHTNMRNYCDGN